MNSVELRELRKKVGDDVLRGFMRSAEGSVKNAQGFFENMQKAREGASRRGVLLPPPLMDAFTMLLVAQELVEQEIGSDKDMAACLGVLNAMLAATEETWLRIGWDGDVP